MWSFKQPVTNLGLLATIVVIGAVSACDNLDELTGPGAPGDPVQLSRDLTLGELENLLSSGAVRLEVELLSEGAIADEVMVKDEEHRGESESVKGRIAAVEALDGQGTLRLTFGDLAIEFGPETRFVLGGDDEVSRAAFLEHVEAALAEGTRPALEARRGPRDLPQNPDDETFLAASLRVLDELEATEIEIDVDGDNLELNEGLQDGEPDGWIVMLGQRIELRVSDGVTELGLEGGSEQDRVEFEGHVETVDPEAGTFTFGDGTRVRIGDETVIAGGEDEGALTSLEAVRAALEAGEKVVAWGAGLIESEDPVTILAEEVHFAIAGDDGQEDRVEFEGRVTSVDLQAGSFTLKNGTIVLVVAESEIGASEDGLHSLGDVAEALELGASVIAYGLGEVESVEPLVLTALELHFALDADDEGTAFEGFVSSVDLEGHSFTLESGTTVHLGEGAEIRAPEAGGGLMSLAEVAEALEVGQAVVAHGKGHVTSEEPPQLDAIWVTFTVSD